MSNYEQTAKLNPRDLAGGNTLSSARLLAYIRLKMPGTPALAPARIAVAGWRAREVTRAGSASDETGLAREALQHQSAYLVLAEAAWRGSLAAPEQGGCLASETYLALQDPMMGAASQAMAETAARNAAEGSGTGLGGLTRERQQQSTDGAPTMSPRPRRLRTPGVPKRAFCRGG